MIKNLFLMAFLLMGHLVVTAQRSIHFTRTSESLYTGLEDYIDPQLYPFYHGVASGDPLTDRVILWTRVSPEDTAPVSVSWKIATDPQLTDIVGQGSTRTDERKDFTVKVDVTGLRPGTTYYYGFTALGRSSLTGRTRTAPENADRLKLAVVSCSNYQNGFFSAYRRISERSDIDAVVHLGDYIYEYKEGDFGGDRPLLPENEIIDLEDYRVRYSFYRLDPDLRAAHQQHPFITVWDDHEFANNAYKDGAENHQANEGDWNRRKNNAFQSYFEWMPVRQNNDPDHPYRIYRTIRYGNLLDLIMLDTRIEARDKQDDTLLGLMRRTSAAMQKSVNNREKNTVIAKSNTRQMLEQYLPLFLNIEGYDKSDAPKKNTLSQKEFSHVLDRMTDWALKIGQKDARAARSMPQKDYEDVLKTIKRCVKYAPEEKEHAARAGKQLLGGEQFAWLEGQLKNSRAQWKVLGNQVLLFPVSGLTISDTWDGYGAERSRLFDFLEDNDIKNVAVVTGDIHSTFASDLPENTFLYSLGFRNSLGVEFVTPSITSSNFDEIAGLPDGFLSSIFGLVNPHVKVSDLNNHGYMVLNIDRNKVQTDWYYINDIKQPNSGEFYGQSWLVRDGEQRLREATAPIPSVAAAADTPAPAAAPNGTADYDHKGLVFLGAYTQKSRRGTALHYFIDRAQEVTVEVYDINGTLKENVRSTREQAGNHLVQVGTGPLKNGTYLFRISTAEKSLRGKFIVRH